MEEDATRGAAGPPGGELLPEDLAGLPAAVFGDWGSGAYSAAAPDSGAADAHGDGKGEAGGDGGAGDDRLLWSQQLFRAVRVADRDMRMFAIEDLVDKLHALYSRRPDIVHAHIPTLTRLSRMCPLADVREAFCELVDDLGLADRLMAPPPTASLFFDEKAAYAHDGRDEEELSALMEQAFVYSGRVSNVTRVYAMHPALLRRHLASMHTILHGEGPLPPYWRFFLAVMAVSRHDCLVLYTMLRDGFLASGGPPAWLLGISHVPRKLRAVAELNALLAHSPWLLRAEHIRELMGVDDSTDDGAAAQEGGGGGEGGGEGGEGGGGGGGDAGQTYEAAEGGDSDASSVRRKATPDADAGDGDADCGASVGSSSSSSSSSATGVGTAWTAAEVVHALIILSTFHAFTGVAWGLGVRLEIDACVADPRAEATQEAEDGGVDEDGDSDAHDSELYRQLLSPGTLSADQAGALAAAEAKAAAAAAAAATAGVVAADLVEGGASAEDSRRRRELEYESAGTGAKVPPPPLLPRMLGRFVGDTPMRYTDFNVHCKTYRVMRGVDMSWEDHAHPVLSRFFPTATEMLSLEFDTLQALTYHSFGENKGVDTEIFRRAVWHYVQRLFGISNDDYDYSVVNKFVKRPVKAYAKTVACAPQSVTLHQFAAISHVLSVSEKAHICLLAVGARKQAALMYGVKALMETLS